MPQKKPMKTNNCSHIFRIHDGLIHCSMCNAQLTLDTKVALIIGQPDQSINQDYITVKQLLEKWASG